MRVPEELTVEPDKAAGPSADDPPPFALMGMMRRSWDAYRAQFTDDEIQRRRERADRELGALLARYVADGYHPDMGEHLVAIVNATLIDFELHEVYVLPGDLARLLNNFGNPLADPEDDDSGDA